MTNMNFPLETSWETTCTLSCVFLGGWAQSRGLPWGILEFTCTPQPGFDFPTGAAVPTASDTAPRQHAVASTYRAGPVAIGARTAESKACSSTCGASSRAADDSCEERREGSEYVPDRMAQVLIGFNVSHWSKHFTSVLDLGLVAHAPFLSCSNKWTVSSLRRLLLQISQK